MTATQTEPLEHWAIVELMGHRRLGGLLTEEERFGVKMLRLDIPPADDDGQTITQLYGGSSIYAITFTDEETARAVARSNEVRPVDAWSARRMIEIDERRTSDRAELQIDEVGFLGES